MSFGKVCRSCRYFTNDSSTCSMPWKNDKLEKELREDDYLIFTEERLGDIEKVVIESLNIHNLIYKALQGKRIGKDRQNAIIQEVEDGMKDIVDEIMKNIDTFQLNNMPEFETYTTIADPYEHSCLYWS